MANTKRQKIDRVAESLNAVVEMFTTGSLPEKIAQTVILRKVTDAPIGSWSLGNQLIALTSGTVDARGYKQWQQVGRQVKKGAKAVYILAPMTRKYKIENKETGEEEEKVAIYGFRGIPVFRLEDTEGEPVEIPDHSPDSLPPLWQVAEAWGLDVKHGPFVGSYRGYYNADRKEIMLCTHDARTFFHELAHAAHDRIEPLRDGQVASQEIVAETAAATICHLYGMDGYLWHGSQYIQGYAKGKNPGQAAMKVLSKVQRVLEEIFNTAEALEANADKEVA